jgi:hypothetical protein
MPHSLIIISKRLTNFKKNIQVWISAHKYEDETTKNARDSFLSHLVIVSTLRSGNYMLNVPVTEDLHQLGFLRMNQRIEEIRFV